MIISFITPVLNEEKYIEELLLKIENVHLNYNFEWIFIDDGSTDQSYDLILKYKEKIPNIKLYKNDGKGKIAAINQAFKISNGQFVKLVGGDDIIDFEIIREIEKLKSDQALIHNGKIVNENGKYLTEYIPPFQLMKYDYDRYLSESVSIPSWCWAFPKEKAKLFFPIPSCQYEDLYLSFCIKKFLIIKYVNKNFYTYKQNPGQTFGNILKVNKKLNYFRSLRAFKSLSVIKKSKIFSLREKFLISSSRSYFILLLKNKNIFEIITSNIGILRILKAIIIKKTWFLNSLFQKTKYLIDNLYYKYFYIKKSIKKDKSIQSWKNTDIEFSKKKLIIIKSNISYPPRDGLTKQFINLFNFLNKSYDCHSFFFVNKNFNKESFLNNFNYNKNIKIFNNYNSKFIYFLINLIINIIFYKLKITKNNFFKKLENFSEDKDCILFINDIIFYPLFFLKLDKKKIIFSLTDFQTQRFWSYLKISKIFLKIYYFFALVHTCFVEFFLFRKIRKIHVYSFKDKENYENIFKLKNIISIPNYPILEDQTNSISVDKYLNNKNKILIMGDFNDQRNFSGLKKFLKLKFLKKFEKKFTFVLHNNNNVDCIRYIRRYLTNIEISSTWIDDSEYLNFLKSFKLLLFLDYQSFGLSNRVLDGILSCSLMVGFDKAFYGYDFKNFKEVIFLNNFFDLVYAYNLKKEYRDEIIENVKNIKNNYNMDSINQKWKQILI